MIVFSFVFLRFCFGPFYWIVFLASPMDLFGFVVFFPLFYFRLLPIFHIGLLNTNSNQLGLFGEFPGHDGHSGNE
jgi:hypothetical protein